MNNQVILVASAPSQPVYTPQVIVVPIPSPTDTTQNNCITPIKSNNITYMPNKSKDNYNTNNNKYCNDYTRCLCCMCILCTDITRECRDCLCTTVNNPEICSTIAECLTVICGYGLKALCCCCEVLDACKKI